MTDGTKNDLTKLLLSSTEEDALVALEVMKGNDFTLWEVQDIYEQLIFHSHWPDGMGMEIWGRGRMIIEIFDIKREQDNDKRTTK